MREATVSLGIADICISNTKRRTKITNCRKTGIKFVAFGKHKFFAGREWSEKKKVSEKEKTEEEIERGRIQRVGFRGSQSEGRFFGNYVHEVARTTSAAG